MFRLGTRADSTRTSSPLEFSTSSCSPPIVNTEIGTSLMFSARRSAVTVTVCSLPASAGGSAGAAPFARAAGGGGEGRARGGGGGWGGEHAAAGRRIQLNLAIVASTAVG